jgi:RNA polymerase sigma-70 factor (ECF subfamily)
MVFPTTQWKLVAEATLDGDASGRQALDQLCEMYRRPVVIFLAGKGYRGEELEDLVQDFFLRWLRSWAFKRADPKLGRFRTFLLAAVCHMLSHYHESENTLKRGGAERVMVSLEEVGELSDGMSEPRVRVVPP